MFDFPILTLIYLICCLLGLFMLWRLIARYWRGNLRKQEGVKRIATYNAIIQLLVSLLLITFAAAVFWFTMALRAYQVFTREELVAIVRCTENPAVPGELKVMLRRVEDGKQSEPENFVLKGDQWAIEGHILKWDNWLHILGIHNCYKLTRLSGRYLHVRDELTRERTVYDLGEGNDRLWNMLYRKGQGFPFVDAVYGSSTFTFPDDESSFGVYVGLNGFMVRKIAGESMVMLRSAY